jgi:hypothetical protein
MPLLALWVVSAPFAGGAAIASTPSLRGAVARHYVAALTLGWLALLWVVASVLVVNGEPLVTTLIAAPFAGLAFWARADGPDEPDGDDDDDEPGPDPGGIDWDDFQRQLDEWAKRPLVHR